MSRLIDADKIDFREVFKGESDFAKDTREAAQSLIDAQLTVEAPTWILCGERLPEKYGEYLCCDKYGEFIIGYPTERVSEESFYVETEHEIMNDCIAWMPLPQPYKEQI